MKLKDRIKKARLDAGLTQDGLAKEVNRLTHNESDVDRNKFTQVQVSDLERGKSHRSVYLPHIAVACGVSAAYLAFGIGPAKIDYEIPASGLTAGDDPKGLNDDEIDTLRRLLAKVESAG